MADTEPKSRPLSPHLQIYRPMLTMMMSIMHRITGVALYAGSLLFVWWLFAAAMGNKNYVDMQEVFGSFLGRLVLFGFTWALIHHMLGGVRHLLWDTGRGFDLKTVEWLARANLALSILLTLGVWIIGYWVRSA